MRCEIKPWIFVDLDDTLFQTKRKMPDMPDTHRLRTGAIDRQGNARSFMSPIQSQLVDWLLANAELIPVTARGTEELSRVVIPFSSWSITTHGAVIRDARGNFLDAWRQRMLNALTPYATQLEQLQSCCMQAFSQFKVDGWARINREYGDVPVYLVMKHRNSQRISDLYQIADWVAAELDLTGFYRHQNDNNVAWLPECVNKGAAVQYLLTELISRYGPRPILGIWRQSQ